MSDDEYNETGQEGTCSTPAIDRRARMTRGLQGFAQRAQQRAQELANPLTPGGRLFHRFTQTAAGRRDSTGTGVTGPRPQRPELRPMAPLTETDGSLKTETWEDLQETDDSQTPLVGGLYKDTDGSVVPWVGTDPDSQVNCWSWNPQAKEGEGAYEITGRIKEWSNQ